MEENKKINQDGYFEDIVDDLEEGFPGDKQVSGEEKSQLLPNEVMEKANQEESFEEIALALGRSIDEHEQLDKKEQEQETRWLNHEERAKRLAEQERLHDEKEAELLAQERAQELRAQALKEKEEKQRNDGTRLPSKHTSTAFDPLGLFLVMLCLVGVIMFIGLNPSNSGSSSRGYEGHMPSFKEVEIEHSPINESDYVLGEHETIYPWTLEEFQAIAIPDLPIGGSSSLTLDAFVDQYGLASDVNYEKTSVAYDSVSLTYTLSDTEFLTFTFIFIDSRYRIFLKRYEGFDNTALTDYWKDKTGKSWGLADYHALKQNSSYNTKDGHSLTDIITTFGAPSSYSSSFLHDTYHTRLNYYLEDGTAVILNFSSKTNDITDYYLNAYSLETENIAAPE